MDLNKFRISFSNACISGSCQAKHIHNLVLAFFLNEYNAAWTELLTKYSECDLLCIFDMVNSKKKNLFHEFGKFKCITKLLLFHIINALGFRWLKTARLDCVTIRLTSNLLSQIFPQFTFLPHCTKTFSTLLTLHRHHTLLPVSVSHHVPPRPPKCHSHHILQMCKILMLFGRNSGCLFWLFCVNFESPKIL